ncbi:MAG: glycosyltransferase family 2 protein [Candidatus Thermoplasmatota archaeon]|nr:glycosyltransferase family 2 protein [Euryarchaeota archaeon]MBU4031172.1 glycosyltransferase family 2 protein [Candidatus Thermoplasmatota archaeon]MBU4071839.1 glycosyltransferase family 2 protein [Candidatus Thermoplasmatota archaeon]MBU4144663.1 glycosyltransferase family 2 protein [Candidatus Thermoplasmatota archaeon]MBU4592516.1 glycosyltransferase family 2 protein [Candidatus Thermoplasmatota archaeon]
MTAPLVSVIIPTMNEEEAIGEVMDQINSALKGMEYEVLVVDTDSKDRTREIAASKGARVIPEPRRGYGRAYKTGFSQAKGKYIATLDADCTYPAGDIPKFVHILETEEVDFISGDRLTKLEKGVMNGKHRMGNWGLKVAMNVIFSMKSADSQTGMWVFRRSVLAKFNLVSDRMALSEEIKIEAYRKCRYREIPIRYTPRVGEVKLNTWKDGKDNLMFLFSKKMGKVSKAKGEIFQV